jgi:PAS domain S-box-containing protein
VIARTAAVFVAALAAGGLIVAQNARLVRGERRRAATDAARGTADAIQHQLEGSLAAPYALAAAVRQSGGVHEFDRYAGELLGVFGGIDSLQLAPGGVLAYVHPLPGNEAALGVDLLASPLHRPEVLRAIATRRLVLVGPFPLRQGGVGLAARVAVFVNGEDGTERFWGVASAILGLPRLLEAARVQRLSEAGYEYELDTSSASAGGDHVAASPGASAMRDPVVVHVKLPSGEWSLAVAPRQGWGAGRWILLQAVGALGLALVLAALAYRVFRLPMQLAQQVTERTAELQLASSEREALLQGIPDAAWLKDRDGRMVAVNEALARLARTPGAALLGRTHAEIFGGASAVEIEANDARVLAMATELVVEERVEDGEQATVFEVVKRPYRDANGAVIGTLGIARDITERRKLEARVRQAEKMEAVGRLAGGIAHDFNNILTVVLGSASELRERGDPAARELADEVLEGGRRAAALTRQLLAFSRKQALRLGDVDVNDVVRGFERMLRRVIPEDVVIETRLHPAPVVVHADAGQLEQVLLNLVMNARDAMPGGGRIAIETGTAERAPGESGVAPVPCVVLVVRDSGDGMDAAVRAHLFEPFFTTKGVGQGTGLGLATVFGIVKQSGGGVAVESAPGAGTTFLVYLPQVEARPAAVPPQIPSSAGGHEAVLVVEDDDAVRALMRRALAAAGYAVRETARPEEALALANGSAEFDVLLTDMVMPGMSGRELAGKLLAERPGLRVVFVSGYTEDAVLRSGALPAGQVFLPKPFTGDAIAAAVRAALDGPAPTA